MRYHFFYLELALKDEKDASIYGAENISHIPTSELIEVFNIDIAEDPEIVNGYFLEEEMYKKHRDFFKKYQLNINLDVFEYALMHFEESKINSIRKLYKEKIVE